MTMSHFHDAFIDHRAGDKIRPGQDARSGGFAIQHRANAEINGITHLVFYLPDGLKTSRHDHGKLNHLHPAGEQCLCGFKTFFMAGNRTDA